MRRLTFAVDWDGTCVEDAWPAMGDWRPGAIDALKKLSELAHIVIHTCRIAPMEFHDMDTPRPTHEVEAEIAGVRAMLDEAGLTEVEIWTRPFKPPAVEYVDNRARRYHGHKRSWETLTATLTALYGTGDEDPFA